MWAFPNYSFQFYDKHRELLVWSLHSWQACNKNMKWTSYSKRRIIDKRTSWHRYMLEMIQKRGKLNPFLGNAQTLLILCYWTMWKLYIELSLTYTKKYHGIILTSLWAIFPGAWNWEHSFNKHILCTRYYARCWRQGICGHCLKGTHKG